MRDASSVCVIFFFRKALRMIERVEVLRSISPLSYEKVSKHATFHLFLIRQHVYIYATHEIDMKSVLETNPDIKSRIKKLAKQHQRTSKQTTTAILEWILPRFESGELTLTTPSVKESEKNTGERTEKR